MIREMAFIVLSRSELQSLVAVLLLNGVATIWCTNALLTDEALLGLPLTASDLGLAARFVVAAGTVAVLGLVLHCVNLRKGVCRRSRGESQSSGVEDSWESSSEEDSSAPVAVQEPFQSGLGRQLMTTKPGAASEVANIFRRLATAGCKNSRRQSDLCKELELSVWLYASYATAQALGGPSSQAARVCITSFSAVLVPLFEHFGGLRVTRVSSLTAVVVMQGSLLLGGSSNMLSSLSAAQLHWTLLCAAFVSMYLVRLQSYLSSRKLGGQQMVHLSELANSSPALLKEGSESFLEEGLLERKGGLAGLDLESAALQLHKSHRKCGLVTWVSARQLVMVAALATVAYALDTGFASIAELREVNSEWAKWIHSPSGAWEEVRWSWQGVGEQLLDLPWQSVLCSSILSTGICHLVLSYCLQSVRACTAALIFATVPVWAMLLQWVFQTSSLPFVDAFGAALVVLISSTSQLRDAILAPESL